MFPCLRFARAEEYSLLQVREEQLDDGTPMRFMVLRNPWGCLESWMEVEAQGKQSMNVDGRVPCNVLFVWLVAFIVLCSERRSFSTCQRPVEPTLALFTKL